jgi:hypothetical protein
MWYYYHPDSVECLSSLAPSVSNLVAGPLCNTQRRLRVHVYRMRTFHDLRVHVYCMETVHDLRLHVYCMGTSSTTFV